MSLKETKKALAKEIQKAKLADGFSGVAVQILKGRKLIADEDVEEVQHHIKHNISLLLDGINFEGVKT